MFNVYYKILKLVYKFDKFGVIKLNFILIFSSIIEGLSIALIFPIIGLVVDNKKSYIFFDNFPFINLNPESALFFALLFLLIIFSLKSMFLLYFAWWKSGFIFKINNSFSKQVFENYHLFTGKVLNQGNRRGDFVQVIYKLWGENTQIINSDSAFVSGNPIKYNSGIVTDTALKPNKSARFNVQVPIDSEIPVSYITREVHWLIYN